MKHYCFVYAFAVFAAVTTIPSTYGHDGHNGHTCGTHSRPLKELELVQRQIESLKKTRSSATCKQCIGIDTYMTVIQGASSKERITITQAILDAQVAILISSYADTPFTFNIKKTTFVEDDFYSRSWFQVDEAFPGTLVAKYPRQGDIAALNIWFGGIDEDFSFAYYPAQGGVASNPTDGVFNGLFAFQGYDDSDEILGLTLVHEVSAG
jgi:hypothetical protein